MGIKNKIPEEEVEGVVYLEQELVSAIEELWKYKGMYCKNKKNKKIKKSQNHMT